MTDCINLWCDNESEKGTGQWCRSCWDEYSTADMWYILGYINFTAPAIDPATANPHLKNVYAMWEMGRADRRADRMGIYDE